MKSLVIKLLIVSIAVLIFIGCNNSNPRTNKNNLTLKNLKTAYKHEIEACAKYAAFAKKTREEGMDRLSVLFISESKAKNIIANNFKAEIEKLGAKVDSTKPEFEVKTTLENLHESNKQETNDFINIYPKFVIESKKENSEGAENLFIWVIESDKKNNVFIADAIQAIDQHTTNAFYTLYLVCPKCGNIYYPHQVDEKCSNCKTEKEKFIPIG